MWTSIDLNRAKIGALNEVQTGAQTFECPLEHFVRVLQIDSSAVAWTESEEPWRRMSERSRFNEKGENYPASLKFVSV